MRSFRRRTQHNVRCEWKMNHDQAACEEAAGAYHETLTICRWTLRQLEPCSIRMSDRVVRDTCNYAARNGRRCATGLLLAVERNAAVAMQKDAAAEQKCSAVIQKVSC